MESTHNEQKIEEKYLYQIFTDFWDYYSLKVHCYVLKVI